MPLYEYKCNACGQVFEKMQKFSDEPLKTCECGKSGEVQRLISPPAFHLKGGGWYKDLYASSSAPSKSSSGSSSSGSSQAKSDAKPAAASTSTSSSSSSDSK